jgi:TatD DNase family protein
MANTMSLVDTHAHLDDDQFDADRDAVIERAAQAGVEAIVAVGVTASSSASVVALAQRHAQVFAAVGIHPNHCAEAARDDWNAIVRFLAQAKVRALGETGLDRYRDYAPLDLQQDYFDRHLRLSQEHDLPFVVHTRESDDEVLAMLEEARRRGPLRGVMHSFTGSPEMAQACLGLGLYISFAGMVTFKKSEALRAIAATVPGDRILVETDSPYLAPHPLRGKRNEPAHVTHTAACVAQARGQSTIEFAAQSTANARRLFRLEG